MDGPRLDVVAFGGIPDPSYVNMRVSRRIQAQPDADYLQIEHAMWASKLRDCEATTGYLLVVCMDPCVVITQLCESHAAYGLCVQPLGDEHELHTTGLVGGLII